MSKKIHLVYYTYIGGVEPFPDGKYFWKDVILGQLKDIKNSGILEASKLYIIICSERQDLLDEAKTSIESFFNGVNVDYTIEFETVNTYEYPGIKKIYDISLEHPDSVCLYTHSKQLGHSNVLKNHRGHTEMVCTQNTINHWKKILTLFEESEWIQKICLFPSPQGFSWFNFWWARTNYIAKCNKPSIESDRYYYERWLGEQGSNTSQDCLSIATGSTTQFSGSEACGIVNGLHFNL